MPGIQRLDFAVQRNEDFGPFAFKVLDTVGAPVSVEGWIFNLVIDGGVGRSGPQLSVTQFPGANGSYVAATGDEEGELEIFVSRDDMADLLGPATNFVALVHNLIASDEVGYERVIARGNFTAEPGV